MPSDPPSVDEPGVGIEPVAPPEAVMPQAAAPDLPPVVVPNLNVNIRILSPGDDGDVTQVNGISLGGGAAGGTLDWDWNWNWNWTCAPANSLSAAAWNWNWNWSADCAAPFSADSPTQPHSRSPASDAVGRPLAPAPAGGDEAAPGRPRSAEDDKRADSAAPAVAPGPAEPPASPARAPAVPPGALGSSVTAAASVPTATAGDPAVLHRPVPRRIPPPVVPPLSGTATAGVGGGGGTASLLLAALLGGLVLLAPPRGARAPMRDRNLHSSLSSERLERPG
jgi:hypothetical protein